MVRFLMLPFSIPEQEETGFALVEMEESTLERARAAFDAADAVPGGGEVVEVSLRCCVRWYGERSEAPEVLAILKQHWLDEARRERAGIPVVDPVVRMLDEAPSWLDTAMLRTDNDCLIVSRHGYCWEAACHYTDSRMVTDLVDVRIISREIAS